MTSIENSYGSHSFNISFSSLLCPNTTGWRRCAPGLNFHPVSLETHLFIQRSIWQPVFPVFFGSSHLSFLPASLCKYPPIPLSFFLFPSDSLSNFSSSPTLSMDLSVCLFVSLLSVSVSLPVYLLSIHPSIPIFTPSSAGLFSISSVSADGPKHSPRAARAIRRPIRGSSEEEDLVSRIHFHGILYFKKQKEAKQGFSWLLFLSRIRWFF